MDHLSGQDNSTIRSPSFPLRQSFPHANLDLANTLLSDAMNSIEDSEDQSRVASAPLKTPDSEKSQFFDLHPPVSRSSNVKIEDLAKRLFSEEHLLFILHDHALFQKFSIFMNRFRPHLVPILVRYLEMTKAMKAIEYANAVARKIRWPSHADLRKFSRVQAAAVDVQFDDYSTKELILLVKEALPAWVTYNLTNIVVDCVEKDITGHRVPLLQDLVGNLAEVFCLTDPSVHDNPIVYATEEFHQTTQYGTEYAIDSNCRFLQGPCTDKDAIIRVSQAIARGQEVSETLLNYRRDGTPFINLCIIAPLHDDKGTVRYFIGAQIDVSGLVEEGRGIESFQALLRKNQEASQISPNGDTTSTRGPRLSENGDLDTKKSTFHDRTQDMLGKLQELSNMFSQDEADIVTKSSRLSGSDKSSDASSISSGVPTIYNGRGPKRILDSEDTSVFGYRLSQLNLGHNGPGASLPGVYKHYLLVKPYPSLQITFVSPSLRLPGLLRTNLFSKLGGSQNTLSALEEAFKDGVAVTAKVLWLPKNNGGDNGMMTGIGREAKPKWIRCTPLLGNDGRVGVWMAVMVPVEGDGGCGSNGHTMRLGVPNMPSPISGGMVLGMEWDGIVDYDVGTNIVKEMDKNVHHQTSIHGDHSIVLPQYTNGRISRASVMTHRDDMSTAEDPEFETGKSRDARAGTVPPSGLTYGRNHGGYGYGIRRSSSQTQLSNRAHGERRHAGGGLQAGSPSRGQGRLWMDATKGSDTEMYAEYLRSSSSASGSIKTSNVRVHSRTGVRGRRDSGIVAES
ncbi:non-specific serine/threonine protein kinase [Sclerotinia borealis F-4128]|uniref:Non-specific serine/threonine protein kinase n=1 Tax=Sclerotinia borealis (strain F-4128) TaxID=1432307 RepID=W9CUX1_SCLBF|nr:non-specific serine/threonine protein kinase [Sclerotinia borealis F-4128]